MIAGRHEKLRTKSKEMPDNGRVKGKEDGVRKVKYVRRFKRNRGIAADCWREYRVPRPASLGKAKAGPALALKLLCRFRERRTTFLLAVPFITMCFQREKAELNALACAGKEIGKSARRG